ncbi:MULTISPECIES: hypothetical protein [unclassified Pseudomonas]|uniref:hypothetical protein n=1 Tax=unclassified Pseudomonas TaxID=196821 RepID=UPI00156D555C|nr:MULTISPECIES: hypothetical protein [unclassified Pseudomonas]QKL03882.1 hypothetical protein GEV39_22055 [Pseudomonas sp. NY5710]
MTNSVDKVELDVIFTHTYYVVTIAKEPGASRFSMPIIRDEVSAEEIAAMLRLSFPGQEVKVIWVAAHPHEDINECRIVADHMADLVGSVRTAADPGHELMSRLGFFGRYEGSAPQNPAVAKRGAGGAA